MLSPKSTNRSFLEVALSKTVVVRAAKVAIIVGTILALINYSDKIFSLSLSNYEFLKILLTYFVPYAVSTWSSVSTLKANAASIK